MFSILVKRGEKGRFGADLECSIADIKQATNLTNNELRECFSILNNAGLTFDNDVNDFGVQLVGIAEAKSGWPVWSDLKKFCNKKNIDISLMIEGLDFSPLGG